MPNASPILTQLNGGELSPRMVGRVDTDAYRKGCRTMRNMIPYVQGAAARRAGTRFLGGTAGATTGGSVPALLIPFIRSATESFVLELVGTTMRFWQNGALVTSGGPYTIGTPYSAGDLFNADGTTAIQVVQSADVMYFVHPKYPTQKLQHFGTTNWAMAAAVFADGPWLSMNADLTNVMTVSAISGSGITVTASQNTFTPNCVGQKIRIYQNDLSQLKAWYPGQRTTGGNLAVGMLRRSGSNTYKCKSVAPGTPPAGIIDWVETGSDALIATTGDQWDGPQDVVPDPGSPGNYYSRGVQWTYQDSGYGVGTITAYIDPKTVTIVATRQFPKSLLVGDPSLVASNRFQLGAWSADLGYPSCVCFFRERLTFGGGIYVWMSVANDFENFADQDFGQIAADNAVTLPVLSDEVNTIAWFSPSDVLEVGTTGYEHIIGPANTTQPFGPANATVTKQSDYGGRSIKPIRIGASTLFVTRTGRYVREFIYDFVSNNYESHDVTVGSEHITKGGVCAMAWAMNPNTVVWMALQAQNLAGTTLIGLTFNKDEKCIAWHNHPLGDSDTRVISMAVVPSATGDVDQLHLCVTRKINNVQVYFIERLEQEWQAGDAQSSAFYVDAGKTYNGAPTMVVPGFLYLRGKKVAILADGQPQAQKTVSSSGLVTLDVQASVVQIGLPQTCVVAPMRIEAGAQDGTSQGKIKRINKVVFRFLNSLGGKYGRDPLDTSQPFEELSYTDPPTPISDGTTFFTGDTPRLPWPGGYEQEGYIGYINDQPLPVTLCAIMPAEIEYEGWS